MFFNTSGYLPFTVNSSNKLNKISCFNKINLTVFRTNFRLAFNNKANFLIIVIPLKFAWLTFPNRPTFYSILNYYACTTGGKYSDFHEIVRMCFLILQIKEIFILENVYFFTVFYFFWFIIKKISNLWMSFLYCQFRYL